MKPAVIAALLATSLACAAAGPRLDRSKLVDLSHVDDESTLYWPNAEGFRHRKDGWAMTDGGYG